MKVFHCDHCDHLVFFENTQCVHCAHALAFLPDVMDLGSLDALRAGGWKSPRYGGQYRLCRNYTGARTCNWAIEEGDDSPLCRSCRLTRVIPNLEVPGNAQAWYRLEVAKRRVVYTLINLGLPLESEDPERSLAFQFLADTGDGTVLTGHRGGTITVNLDEADDAERERRKRELGEPYRTLLGHFRHEVGHYYWHRLIEPQPASLEAFRALFGDERVEYGEALRRYYAAGAPFLWQQQYVTAYATAHPWEDWAETWAHYLHMTDTLETAAACGISLRPGHPQEPSLPRVPDAAGTSRSWFDSMIQSWFPVTYVLNNLNRGLGIADAYPFVLPPPAIDKLRFVHEAVARASARPARAERAGADGRAPAPAAGMARPAAGE